MPGSSFVNLLGKCPLLTKIHVRDAVFELRCLECLNLPQDTKQTDWWG